jgi:hypothetical protein
MSVSGPEDSSTEPKMGADGRLDECDPDFVVGDDSGEVEVVDSPGCGAFARMCPLGPDASQPHLVRDTSVSS